VTSSPSTSSTSVRKLGQRQVGEPQLRRQPLDRALGGKARQLVAAPFRGGLREEVFSEGKLNRVPSRSMLYAMAALQPSAARMTTSTTQRQVTSPRKM
jgi:hypothetical protein